MDDVDPVRKFLENKLKLCDDYLGKAKPIVDSIPIVQDIKEETEAKLAFWDAMSPDFKVERAHEFLSSESSDEKRLRLNLPPLPDVNQHNLSQLSSTGGTILYVEVLQDTGTPYVTNIPAHEVLEMFTHIADERARKATLPPQLDKINHQLGEEFIIARDSVDKAKIGAQTVSQSALALRDVLEHTWSGLADLARQRATALGKSVPPHLEFGSAAHRGFVAEYTVLDPSIKSKLDAALGSMRTLWVELSDRTFGKNLLGVDVTPLDKRYHLWILLISDIVRYVNI